MKKWFLLALPALLVACADKTETKLNKVEIPAFGSYLELSYTGTEIPNYRENLEEFVEEFNSSLSTYRKDSRISQLNRNETQTLDSLNFKVLALSIWMTRASGGAFDVGVGPLVELWGFGQKGEPREVDSSEVEAARKLCGYGTYYVQRFQLHKQDPNVRLDYNAVAPGLAADLIAEDLGKHNVKNFYINVGGEIRCAGVNQDSTTWVIGIEKPIDNPNGTNEAIRYVKVKDKGLATSGNYRKFYVRDGKKYSHTIDPRSGYPVQHDLLSVTIMAPDAAVADALATTCMVLGREGAKQFLTQFQDVDYYFVYAGEGGKMEEEWSPGMEVAFVSESE